MICPEIHDNRIVLWGSCITTCLACNEEISNLHIPGNVVCPKCSEEHEICEICAFSLTPDKKWLFGSPTQTHAVGDRVYSFTLANGIEYGTIVSHKIHETKVKKDDGETLNFID